MFGSVATDAVPGQQWFDLLEVPVLGLACCARSHGREGQQPTKTMG